MIFHAYYADIPTAQVDAFVEAQELGRLISVGGDGTPHVGLYPFVRGERTIEPHSEEHSEGGEDEGTGLSPYVPDGTDAATTTTVAEGEG